MQHEGNRQKDTNIPPGIHCELCGMVAEVLAKDVHGVTHYFCAHHAPKSDSSSQPQHSASSEHGEHHNHAEDNRHAGHSVNMFKQKFWVSLLLTVPIVLYSSMIQDWLHFAMPAFPGSRWLPLILGGIIFFYGGMVFLNSARAEVKSKQPGMMTIISLAIVVAFGYSVVNALWLHGMDFFWDLATLIVIMLLGHWLEMKSVSGAQGALQELAKLLPDTAEKVEGNTSHEVPVQALAVGDIVRVRPGSQVPVDGQVTEGSSSVNESMITGESRLVQKEKGDSVIGGTINGDGVLLAKVTKVGEQTALAGIMRLVAQAQASKSQTQILADQAAGWLFYIALVTGFLTLVGWLAIGHSSANFAFERVVTVLIIACPHALGLAIPLVTAISTSLGARHGLLVRDRAALEQARNLDVVMFDKTGTLTMGQQGVVDIRSLSNLNANELLKLAAVAEAGSEHIIGRAIVAKANELQISLPAAANFRAIAGHGVEATVAGRKLMVGGQRLLEQRKIKLNSEINRWSKKAGVEGKTVVYVLQDSKIIGVIALADMIRSESKEAIEQLHELGVRVAMLTGDSEDVAASVAEQLGIKEYFAQVLPEHKAEKVAQLQKDGSKVAMVGDGVNDAPALAQADIGIAIGAGTDVAIESAGIVLVKSDPRDVVNIITLSQATYRKMLQNLWWGAGYNIVSLPLAAGVLVPIGFILPPAVGAVIMSLSTIIVAANAQLLRRTKLF